MAKLMRAWRWWTARGWAMLLLLAGGMIIFWLGGGWWGHKELEAKMGEVRGRGEPVAMRDVSYPPLKDAENAWKSQLKAINALSSAAYSPRSSNLDYDAPPYPAAWMPWQRRRRRPMHKCSRWCVRRGHIR